MEAREKTKNAIFPAKSKVLAKRSTAIVARGLRELTRDSHWRGKKLFSGRTSSISISPAGQVCALSAEPGSAGKVIVHDLEVKVAGFELQIPGTHAIGGRDGTAVFEFSPSGRHLAAGVASRPSELRLFDLHTKRPVATLGPLSEVPSALAWSYAGNHFAMASRGAEAQIRVWANLLRESGIAGVSSATPGEISLAGLATQSGSSDSLTTLPADEEAASGFGRIDFSPDGRTLAAVVEIEGEWADDSIQLLEIPSLSKQRLMHAQGHITDISWAFDGQLIYCSGGRAFRIVDDAEPEALPFGAELCACHPRLPLCVCFSSWLKNSAREQLFIANLANYKVFDELPAQGIVDLCWSQDGLKAYAVAGNGLAFVCESAAI